MTNYFNIQHIRRQFFSLAFLKKTPRCMKLSAILLFVFAGLTLATESYSQSTFLDINAKNKTVQDVLDVKGVKRNV